MNPDHADRSWAILFARAILGFIFFMAGVWKVFELGPLEHARRLFLVPYVETFLPDFALWTVGVIIPFIELAAGALLLIGFRTREALVALGGVLVVVTFGHLLLEPPVRVPHACDPASRGCRAHLSRRSCTSGTAPT